MLLWQSSHFLQEMRVLYLCDDSSQPFQLQQGVKQYFHTPTLLLNDMFQTIDCMCGCVCVQTEEEKMVMERRVREAEFTAARIVEECERR